MMDRNALELRDKFRAEINVYLGPLPKRIRLEHADVGELSLAVGNMLLWLSGVLDSGPMHNQSPSMAKLGAEFREVGLMKWKGNCQSFASSNGGDPALTQLRAAIDSLRSLERKVTSVN
jgi:hypothetical protein